jgi:DNA-directed RNA polymerase omega subunit
LKGSLFEIIGTDESATSERQQPEGRDMDRITERVDSKFRFVLLAATRAEQLMQGAMPKIEKTDDKVTRIAMNEILEKAVEWDYGPPPEPEAVEAEAAVEDEIEEDGVN